MKFTFRLFPSIVKFYLSIAFTVLLSTHSMAQLSSTPKITISKESNDDGEPTFYAQNHTTIPYTVSVKFSNLENTSPPNPNPLVKTVSPGRTHLVKLRKNFGNNGPIRYYYTYTFKMGCKDTQPDTNIEYLLPVAKGDTIKTVETDDMEVSNHSAAEAQYGLGFDLQKGDTVYAARRGTMGQLIDGFYGDSLAPPLISDYQYLLMVHEDCTFGMYRHPKDGSLLVEQGDEVHAGDPLAVIPSTEKQYRFHFLLMYRNPAFREVKNVDYWNFDIPQFRTAAGKRVHLQANKTYVARHPREVIFQEMNWREKWRWKRRN